MSRLELCALILLCHVLKPVSPFNFSSSIDFYYSKMVVGDPSINNIMSGIENAAGVKQHNHKKKLKQR